jgi:hypothetical protein
LNLFTVALYSQGWQSYKTGRYSSERLRWDYRSIRISFLICCRNKAVPSFEHDFTQDTAQPIRMGQQRIDKLMVKKRGERKTMVNPFNVGSCGHDK